MGVNIIEIIKFNNPLFRHLGKPSIILLFIYFHKDEGVHAEKLVRLTSKYMSRSSLLKYLKILYDDGIIIRKNYQLAQVIDRGNTKSSIIAPYRINQEFEEETKKLYDLMR